MSPAVTGGFLTTEHQGSPQLELQGSYWQLLSKDQRCCYIFYDAQQSSYNRELPPSQRVIVQKLEYPAVVPHTQLRSEFLKEQALVMCHSNFTTYSLILQLLYFLSIPGAHRYF